MSTAHNTVAKAPATMSTGKLAVAWALVGVPLAYGIYQTLTRVAALFG
ncbi:MFS transporter small subunit [Pseudarthrobacter oxydans]